MKEYVSDGLNQVSFSLIQSQNISMWPESEM